MRVILFWFLCLGTARFKWESNNYCDSNATIDSFLLGLHPFLFLYIYCVCKLTLNAQKSASNFLKNCRRLVAMCSA